MAHLSQEHIVIGSKSQHLYPAPSNLTFTQRVDFIAVTKEDKRRNIVRSICRHKKRYNYSNIRLA